MVTNLQFAAVAAYLLWCLAASLSGVLDRDNDEDDQANICESDKTAIVGGRWADDGVGGRKGV